MPSILHDAIVRLLEAHPHLLALADLPSDGWTSRPADLTQTLATELRADLVLRHPRLALVVEVQLAIDPQNRLLWPLYLASTRAREHLDTLLLVLTPTPRVAAWARRPIRLGGDSLVQPLVLLLPELSLPPPEADPHHALLIALGHSRGPLAEPAARAALAATSRLDTPLAREYTSLILTTARGPVRLALEALMLNLKLPEPRIFRDIERRAFREGRQEGRQEGQRLGHERGHQEGLRDGLLTALTTLLIDRFGPLPHEVTQRLAGADADTLRHLLLRYPRATSPAHLLDDTP